MDQAINWKDDYTDTKYRKILVAESLGIPGLRVFGRQIRTSATESLPLHFHENCFEVVYISSGTSSFYVDGKTYRLSGGDLFVTQPSQMHGTNAVPVAMSEMYWPQFTFDDCRQFFHLDDVAIGTLRDRLSHLPSPKISTSGTEIEKLLEKAFQIALSGSNPQLVSQYLTLPLYLLIEFSEKTIFKLSPDIGRAMNYMLDHITEPPPLEEVAARVFLSTSQFKQKFKKQVGISPRQFINAQKMEYAKDLFETGCSVDEVSDRLHFASSSYFTVVFKKFCSCTPSEYKTRFDPHS